MTLKTSILGNQAISMMGKRVLVTWSPGFLGYMALAKGELLRLLNVPVQLLIYNNRSLPALRSAAKLYATRMILGFDPPPVYNIPTSCETPTMNITIRFGEPLRRAIGRHRLHIHQPSGATLADLLQTLHRTYPDFEAAFAGVDLGHAHPYHVFLNHRHVVPEQWEHTQLHEGDVVHIVIPALGGAT